MAHAFRARSPDDPPYAGVSECVSRRLFPNGSVAYFVSFCHYYQPDPYIPQRGGVLTASRASPTQTASNPRL